jgi:hypothetical protein
MVVAEWLELLALTRKNGSSSAADLESLFQGSDDDLAVYEGDQVEQDEEVELLIQEVFNELDSRSQWGGKGYPFDILRKNNVLKLRNTSPRFVCLAYLLSLLISFLKRFKESEIKDAFPAYDQIEDLFQICGTIAAAGYIEGSSVSFGFPRVDATPFYEKLLSVSQLMGEGIPKQAWDIGGSAKPNDAGVDIIAWRECPDRLPGLLYLLGQCATGKSWQTEKNPSTDYSDFHEYYWAQHPHSPLISATLIPFDLRESITKGKYKTIDDAYFWERWTLTKQFGVLLDRFRLAHYYAKGLTIIFRSGAKVEGRKQLRDVRKWVADALQYLRQEHVSDAA